MIPVEEALRIVLESSRPLGTERVPLDEALDRFLAEPVVARDTIPPAPTSAMDGFAVLASDSVPGPWSARVMGEVPAGSVRKQRLGPGTAVKIFTGALLPPGADAVVMVEHAHEAAGRVSFRGRIRPGTHVRPAGEVVARGDRLLPAGIRLGPGHLGLLATLGYPRPRCARRPRVAILPTGSELIGIGDKLRPGQVRDSNSIALAAQVRRAGGLPTRLPPVADDRRALKEALARALADHDLVVTSGGVSMGDYDFVGETLEALGLTIHFTKVRTKPGKPVTYATRGAKQVFGLPGNPVSSMVSFELFTRPSLRARMGALAPTRPELEVQLDQAIEKAPDRRDYQRARLELDRGTARARTTGSQGSAVVVSMAAAQALLVLAEDQTRFAKGTKVPAILLDEALERRTS